MFYSLFSPQFDSLVKLTIRLLDNLNVKVNSSSVNKALQDHPEYPSLLSVCDVLNQWNVHNMAIQVHQSRINELPLPFIAHIETSLGEHFELVINLMEDAVEYFDHANEKKVISLKTFQKNWTGIVLLAEATKDSGELNYEINLKKERRLALLPFAYLAIGLIITVLSISLIFVLPIGQNNLEIYWAIMAIIKFAGVLISTILLWFDVDQGKSFLYKVCGNGSRTNCLAVLNSKGAQIIPGLSWSELGFFYFVGGWIFTVISTFTSHIHAINFLFILNLVAMPYIFYSLYYQSIVVKQWCKMCLFVLSLLILEFTTFSIGGFSNFYANFELIDITLIAALFFAFTIPIIVWYMIKPRIVRLEEKEAEVKQLKKIKFNAGVFLNLLKCQRKMPQIQEGIGIIIQGKKRNNSNSDVHILQVCNLYCSACAQAQSFIEEFIEKTENLKIQIVFIGTETYDDQTLLIMNHIINIAQFLGSQEVIKALGDWYINKERDYGAFVSKNPIKRKINLKSEVTNDMKQWCEKANIKFTPTYYINGLKLPDGYFIEDLKYFISTDTFWQR